MSYPYKLPELTYSFDALEPYIDAKTMEIHYGKHHQAYVNNLNAALKDHPSLQTIPLEQLLTNIEQIDPAVRTAIRNHGGGTLNHTMFWSIMKPNGGGNPQGSVAEVINKTFHSFEQFQQQFNDAAKTVFGSGWAWLSVDTNGTLVINKTLNQDSPLSEGLKPILCLDVWEHAYYLKYQNRRPDYITAWWHVVNWDQVEDNYRSVLK